jgi:hypothetical protein
MKAEQKIKNKKIIILGFFSALVFSLILCEFIQGCAAFLAGATNLSFGFSGIKLYAVFHYSGTAAASVIIYSIPFWLMLAGIYLPVYGLKKTEPGRYRHFFIVFSLVQSGLLIFNLFHGAFSIILKANLENDWVCIVNTLKLDEAGALIFVILMVLFTAGYLNLLLKTILKYININ